MQTRKVRHGSAEARRDARQDHVGKLQNQQKDDTPEILHGMRPRNLHKDIDEIAGDKRLRQREHAVQHAERNHSAEQGGVGIPDQSDDKQQMPCGGSDLFRQRFGADAFFIDVGVATIGITHADIPRHIKTIYHYIINTE